MFKKSKFVTFLSLINVSCCATLSLLGMYSGVSNTNKFSLSHFIPRIPLILHYIGETIEFVDRADYPSLLTGETIDPKTESAWMLRSLSLTSP